MTSPSAAPMPQRRDKDYFLLAPEYQTPFSQLSTRSGDRKDLYGAKFAKVFFRELSQKASSLGLIIPQDVMLAAFKKSYKALEMKDRLKLIAAQVHDHLTGPVEIHYEIFQEFMGRPWPLAEGMMNYAFFLYPLSQLIESYDQYHDQKGLDFLEALTQRFTGEFAIRPFLQKDPAGTLRQMKAWAKHDNFHVRRLASEGLRIRLPWGVGVPWLKNQPQKTLPVFRRLRNDPSLYVRRSVANAMGDMIKVDPDLCLQEFELWMDKKLTHNNLWVIRHAIRHPCKKKNPQFLSLKNKVVGHMKNLK